MDYTAGQRAPTPAFPTSDLSSHASAVRAECREACARAQVARERTASVLIEQRIWLEHFSAIRDRFRLPTG